MPRRVSLPTGLDVGRAIVLTSVRRAHESARHGLTLSGWCLSESRVDRLSRRTPCRPAGRAGAAAAWTHEGGGRGDESWPRPPPAAPAARRPSASTEYR